MNRLMVIYPIETYSGKENIKFCEKLVGHFPSIRTWTEEKTTPPTVLLLFYVFVAAGTCLPSR
jgi:hypothetical protein